MRQIKFYRDFTNEDLKYIIKQLHSDDVEIQFEYYLFKPRWRKTRKYWRYSKAYRTDALVVDKGIPYIYETDIQLTHATLGQLISYSYLYEYNFHVAPICRAIGRYIDEIACWLMIEKGHEVITVDNNNENLKKWTADEVLKLCNFF